jgi:predicted nucleic acid-binding protein
VSLAYLIDTDWVIDHFHGVESVTRKLDELRPAGLAISIVSPAELYEGIHYSRNFSGPRALRPSGEPLIFKVSPTNFPSVAIGRTGSA